MCPKVRRLEASALMRNSVYALLCLVVASWVPCRCLAIGLPYCAASAHAFVSVVSLASNFDHVICDIDFE